MASWSKLVQGVVDMKHNKTGDTFQLGALLARRSPGCFRNIEQKLHLGEGKIRESFLDNVTSKFRLKERLGWFEMEGGKESSKQMKQYMQRS